MGSRIANARPIKQAITPLPEGHTSTSPPCTTCSRDKQASNLKPHKSTTKMASTPWGYEAHNGPDKWHIEFPVAKEGKRQSPIDLSAELAQTDSGLRKTPITVKYEAKNTLNIENTGASWKVNVDGAGSCLTGGALQGEYQLWQFHAHWGSCDEKGSEHTVDGKMYPAELHLVHWNRTKYSSPNEAAGEPDGLAVLGMFLEVGEKHEELDKVLSQLDNIRFKGDKVSFKVPVEPSKFLPKNTNDLYTYEGSLTTPPLLESVIWTVFKEPIQISKSQLEAMRSMKCGCKGDKQEELSMVDNYRPPCSLGNRTIRQS